MGRRPTRAGWCAVGISRIVWLVVGLPQRDQEVGKMKSQITKYLTKDNKRKVAQGFPVKLYPLTNSGNRIGVATSVVWGVHSWLWNVLVLWPMLAETTEWLQSSKAALFTSAKKGLTVKRFGIFRNKMG